MSYLLSFRPKTSGDRRWRYVGWRFWHVLLNPQHVVVVSDFALKNNNLVHGEFDLTDWLRSNVTGYCLVQEMPGWRVKRDKDDGSLEGMIAHITRVMEGANECALRLKFTHKNDAILFKMSLP